MNKRKFILALFLLIDFFVLGAFLGQVDMQLNPWYVKPSSMWWFPWGAYQAEIAWEIEYAIIVVTAVVAFVIGYLLGQEKSEIK